MTTDDARNMRATTQSANDAFINGDFAPYERLYTHAPDLTVFGPFGGDVAKGWDQIKVVSPAIARQFKSGTTTIEPIESYQSGDLFVSVHIERQSVVFAGRGEAAPWSLRVTQVYRREEDGWRVVHRHVDPMTTRRTLDQALKIASE